MAHCKMMPNLAEVGTSPSSWFQNSSVPKLQNARKSCWVLRRLPGGNVEVSGFKAASTEVPSSGSHQFIPTTTFARSARSIAVSTAVPSISRSAAAWAFDNALWFGDPLGYCSRTRRAAPNRAFKALRSSTLPIAAGGSPNTVWGSVRDRLIHNLQTQTVVKRERQAATQHKINKPL